DGAILTSYHVVTKADSIKIYFVNGRSAPAVVEQAGATTDLALLRIAQPTPAHLSLAPSRSAQVGQSVFTLGFPATSLLGVEPKFSEGSISALSGPGGEASLMQISVPVQPGNSGGPLVNDQGQVIGIITATAAILPFVEATGSLPQNVNWAVKADYARPLFNAPAGGVSQAPTRQEAIEKARRAVCRVEASTK
ncbi:MAG: S1C family serine protease, partial [Candidatus Binatia bacterium]